LARRFDARQAQTSIFDALVDASRKHGRDKAILEDQERSPTTYLGLIRASFALGRKLCDITKPGERVGVLLPSSAAAVVTFFALHAFGRTPTMLNFTAGLRNLRAACELADVKRVLTSHRFVEQAKLHDVIDALEPLAAITYLEEVRRKVGLLDKLYAALAGAFPKAFRVGTKPGAPGVILFTSGSFGAPRGVVLTQANLVANARQVAAHIELDPDWTFFNPLPVFHCFGLTGGVLLPLLNGLKAVQYPSPLHTKQIPPLIRDTKAKVLLATDTFVNQYARAADPGDLSGLKFIVCGAEKVREETHNLIAERFGPIPVLEGYGATEASPVIAVNKPTDNRRGTVGGLLPGMEARLDKVDGIPQGGRLHVRGPNIMAGYLIPGGGLEPPPGGWHDTGDVVSISPDNWVKILGRAKRFAKVGGEMVSLTAAEDLASAVWPDCRHAVVAVADPKKGERLILVTDKPDADTAPLLAHAQHVGATELAVPKRIIRVVEIPVLGTGKTDYVALARIVDAELRRVA
jgi:acyl-[acyl-carrier-protein]-phospholipid O-acyltransferase/long-chain-fatty-acid--[acyl-carrier-protein] ligase